MQSNTELEALGRIVVAIKMYRHQTNDYQDLVGNECVDTYLKQHLSIFDWIAWQRVKCGQERGLPFMSHHKGT